MESRIGIAPMHSCFADSGLAPWLTGHMVDAGGIAPPSPACEASVLLLN